MDVTCCFKTPYKKVTHVIFDLDGTLLQSEKIYDSVFTDIAEEYGKKVDVQLLLKIRGSTQPVGLMIFKQELKIEADLEELTEKFVKLTRERLRGVELTIGADQLVRHLAKHKVPMAVATSSHKEEYELKVTNHQELFSLFHHIVCGDDPDVYKSKPNPSIFLVAAERFPKYPAPEECLVFEDSVNGMKGGLRAGMQVVMVPDRSVSYEDWKHATMRINLLNEVALELFGLPPLEDPKQDFCWNLENDN